MGTAIFTNAWINRSDTILFSGGTPPNSAKFYLCLANTSSLGRANTIADFVSAELLPVNGYSRVSVTLTAGTYNPTNQRDELPTPSANFTASGGTLAWQTAFLLADASSQASQSFTNSNISGSVITINSHGFSNGDQLVFTADTLSTLPSGLTAGTLYTVTSATTNTFQLSGVSAIGAGSGTFRARSANGTPVALMIETSPITLLNGQPYNYLIPIVGMNAGYTNGV